MTAADGGALGRGRAAGFEREMVWWGWGAPDAPRELAPGALELLAGELSLDPAALRAPVEIEEVRLADPALPAAARDALVAAVGADGVRDDRRARLAHAAGKSYVDLVRARAGECPEAPDAVVFPETADQVAAVLAACGSSGVAVVPFGGGTSVVGGVAPARGEHAAAISLDLARLDRLVSLDERSLTAVLEPGLRCREADALLARRGLTVGHFPQSYEYATIGGCVATRSAGQASTGYGRIEELVVGVQCVAPAGRLELAPVPASAAGPALRGLVVGSEGALGVITQAALRVRPRPRARRYEGVFWHSFAEGVEGLRALAQDGPRPDVVRLSDEQETRISVAMARGRGPHRLVEAYLRGRGYGGGCLCILGWEGEPDDVARRHTRGLARLRRLGATYVGRRVGEGWARGRFAAPYLRDALLARGVLVETIETAAPWSQLGAVHHAVAAALGQALARRGTPALVGCHVSHLYATGASLYFTLIAGQQPGAEVEQWRVAKVAASEAIVASGATITHHHAIGRDHAPWLAAEAGELGLGALRAVKARLDPAGIMNPGKLLAVSASPGAG